MPAPLIHTVLLLLIEFASSINRSSQTQTSLTQPISNQIGNQSINCLFPLTTMQLDQQTSDLSATRVRPPLEQGRPDPVLEEPDPAGFCVLPGRVAFTPGSQVVCLVGQKPWLDEGPPGLGLDAPTLPRGRPL